MKIMKLTARSSILFAAVVLMAGCAAQQPKEARHFYWPPLPDRPRIEWKKSYMSQLDFPKTDFEKFTAKVTGEEDPIVFDKPVSISSNGDGKVYVTDSGRTVGVFVYDIPARNVHLLGGENSVGLFNFPVAVDLDDDGNIYVADVDKKGVLVFDKNEKPLRMISTKDEVQRNAGIVIDRKRKRLLVVDSREHLVAVYDLNGKHLFTIGERGNEDGKFNFPVCVTVNHQGEIIVGDSMNARIQIFDGEGKFLRKFGNRGDGPADFQILKGVAVDSDDNIYVSEGKGHKVIIFSTRGEYLLTVGGIYSALSTGREAPGGFLIPQGIFIDKNDIIYVVDQLNKRFQVFQYISDKYLLEHPIVGYQEAVGK
jgi:DNA-binding beta-propeller fold protein YncE